MTIAFKCICRHTIHPLFQHVFFSIVFIFFNSCAYISIQFCTSRDTIICKLYKLYPVTPLFIEMPKRVRVQYASLHSSLVNLPVSIYGPLLERNVVSFSTDYRFHQFSLFLATTASSYSPFSCTEWWPQKRSPRKDRSLRWVDWHGIFVIASPSSCDSFWWGIWDCRNRSPIRPRPWIRTRRRRMSYSHFLVLILWGLPTGWNRASVRPPSCEISWHWAIDFWWLGNNRMQ